MSLCPPLEVLVEGGQACPDVGKERVGAEVSAEEGMNEMCG